METCMRYAVTRCFLASHLVGLVWVSVVHCLPASTPLVTVYWSMGGHQSQSIPITLKNFNLKSPSLLMVETPRWKLKPLRWGKLVRQKGWHAEVNRDKRQRGPVVQKACPSHPGCWTLLWFDELLNSSFYPKPVYIIGDYICYMCNWKWAM